MDTITLTQFTEIASKYRIPPEGVGAILRFFHDMGCVVYIDDTSSNVKDLVILNPQWLSDVMASLVNVRYEQAAKQVGIA